jgi:putative transferase (TIGR04331 family)
MNDKLDWYYNELLLGLAVNLNRVHGKEFNRRYWEIIVGPWLKRFVSMTFHRFHALESVFERNRVKNVVTGQNELEFPLVTSSYSDFLWNASNNVEWNFLFESKIIDLLKPDCEIHRKRANLTNFRFTRSESRLKKYLLKLAELFTFGNAQDYFIYASYFPNYLYIKVNLKLLQFPMIWKRYIAKEHATNVILRKELRFPKKFDDKFLLIASSLVPHTLPSIYLEGYQDLVKISGSVNWPANPKLIFTSNAFDDDEVFKCWTAHKVLSGVKYYVGQHGNNYGTKLGNLNWVEQTTCDRFVTWGWKNNDRQIRAFNFKIRGQGKRKPRGGLTLVELHPLHRLGPVDDHATFLRYFESQVQFVSRLPQGIRGALTIRLHSASRYFNWNEFDFWRKNFVDVYIENGSMKIGKLLKNSKLVVHSYDSTGILETLRWNIPTLCFWENGFDHLEKTAIPYYNLLRESNIYFEKPEELVNHIENIWFEVSEWWMSSDVQHARLSFLNEFSKDSVEPAGDLARIFKQSNNL